MVLSVKKKIFTKENVAKGSFAFLAAFSALVVFTIVGYLLYASIPAFGETNLFKFIFGSEWSAAK